ncbi:MAG TPA: type IV toxin-antitoxin system AbiEi family antitoxin domain-containing protein [Lapillicoccus sp.]|nr:type IV toxin-antitoxin system AbiEi family antitoxin domain-containing protein [Lapillicoccus sp.]
MGADQLDDLAAWQAGLVTRRQALAAGLSERQIEWRVRSGRWARVSPGVYLTQPGRRDRSSRFSAAVLACGSGAVLSHWSAAEALGLTRAAPREIHVSVPLARRVVAPPGVIVHRTHGAVDASELWQWPPRTSAERTVIDVAAMGTADDAVAVAALACQRGVTWFEALSRELGSRTRHRWRGVLLDALQDIGAGAESTLEVRFVRDVVRPHGLPTPRAQRTTLAGRHDLGFDEQMVLVELDGLAFHHDRASRANDTRRDRRTAGAGWLTVRAVWVDVALHTCRLAGDVGTVLVRRGWPGRPRPCRRTDCALRP